ncbi:MAG: hypothetical protein NDJ89_10945 [Oligoflexia bacterium]|nr:hypothetical protein [Oligoflexia bacterium]
MKTRPLAFTLTAAGLLLIQAGHSLPAHARGGETGGGGNVLGDELLDLQAEEDVKGLRAYKLVVKPMIERFKKQVPAFGRAFESQLDSLTWYLLPADVPRVDAGINGVPMISGQAAAQVGNEVWIDSRKVRNEGLLGRLIVHEVALSMAAGEEGPVRHAKTRAFVRYVFSPKNQARSEKELALAIAELTDRGYLTRAEEEQAEAAAKERERVRRIEAEKTAAWLAEKFERANGKIREACSLIRSAEALAKSGSDAQLNEALIQAADVIWPALSDSFMALQDLKSTRDNDLVTGPWILDGREVSGEDHEMARYRPSRMMDVWDPSKRDRENVLAGNLRSFTCE